MDRGSPFVFNREDVPRQAGARLSSQTLGVMSINRLGFLVPFYLLVGPACFAQTPTTTVCSAPEGRLSIQYIPDVGDGRDAFPFFPVRCKLGKVSYRVEALQGPFSERRCGAQPPLTITLTRDGRRLISKAVFGVNCFGGAALYQVEVLEKLGHLSAVHLCISTDEPNSEVKCRDLEAKEVISLPRSPITQSGLYKVLHTQ